jgi:WD40 repeat protein
MTVLTLDSFIVAALFVREGAAFVTADGRVRFLGEDVDADMHAHEGSALAACPHPSGSGVITTGDDGRVAWSRPGDVDMLAALPGKWIDAVAASSASGLVAFATGREVHVRDVGEPVFARSFGLARAVSGLDFEPKGKRLAAATYGGAALFYARVADQAPVMLKWAGSHVAVRYSPDGKFLVTATQENELHAWRLADGKDMRMSGYPAKVRSFAFLGKGALLATSGALGAVVWPFAGANGPMGKEAAEVGVEAAGADENLRVTRVAAALSTLKLCAGLSDGRIWSAELDARGLTTLKAETGAPISALAVSPDGTRLAWGDEAGGAGLIDL